MPAPDLFQLAVKFVEDAKRLPVSDATRVIFERFKASSPGDSEALVLALIGDVLTSHVRTRFGEPEQEIPQ